MDPYYISLVFASVAILGAVVLPRLLADRPVSFPMIYVALGMFLFGLPTGLSPPDPVTEPEAAERLTELVVIVSLTGAGLKLDRPFDWRAWQSTWRLLGITMVATIAMVALLGWSVIGLLPAAAVLLGAVTAPTDPVLASDVQVGEPTEAELDEVQPLRQEDEVRFSLTSEAGLNDGLAFPFTYAAIAIATAPSVTAVDWVGEWLAIDVAYKIGVGVAMGYGIGKLLAWLIFRFPAISRLAETMQGTEALAATLLSYGLTELVQAYGFIAVFVTALTMRHYEWEEEYHKILHEFAVIVERLLMAAVLVLFGGAIVGGLLEPLTLTAAAVGLGILFVVRPLAGIVGMIGHPSEWDERLVISVFGIRGIGSFFYLSYALNSASFPREELLWALVGFVVLTSIVVHGLTATPVMNVLDRRREARREDPERVGPKESVVD